MPSRYIPNKDLALLWGRAAGLCSICKVDLLQSFPKSGDVNLGERAHIISPKENGPRGNEKSYFKTEYDNLILLCASHHNEIDKAAEDYPPEKLIQIKTQHETYVRNKLSDVDFREKNRIILDLMDNKPELAIELLTCGGRHNSYSDLVPKFIQRKIGGSFGYYKIGACIKNIGSKVANRITIKVEPIDRTLPVGYTFSTHEHITRKSTPFGTRKEFILGPLNVGESISVGSFFLNYRKEIASYQEISAVEFFYYLTCDDIPACTGKLKISNK